MVHIIYLLGLLYGEFENKKTSNHDSKKYTVNPFSILVFNMSIAQDAQQLLNGVINKINSVKDYSADVNIQSRTFR